MTWFKDITALFSPFLAALPNGPDQSIGLSGRVSLEDVKPDVIAAELSNRYKESHFHLVIEDIGDKKWFVIRRASDPSRDDYLQPLIPYEEIATMAFLQKGVALQLPYGFFPVLEDSGARLAEYEVGEGQRLWFYIPFDMHKEFINGYEIMVGEYQNDPMRQEGRTFQIGAIRDERGQGGQGSLFVPVFLLYPPDFDYSKMFSMEEPRLNLDFTQNNQDICVIFDTSGSMAQVSPERIFKKLFDSNGFIPAILGAKKSRIHVLFSQNDEGRTIVTERSTDSEEAERQKLIDQLRPSFTELADRFYRPAGEEENLPIALSRCMAFSGQGLSSTERAYLRILLITDEEARLPSNWNKYSSFSGVYDMNREQGDLSNIVLGSKLNIPFIVLGSKLNIPFKLAEHIFDAPAKDESGDFAELNRLILKIHEQLLKGETGKIPTLGQLEGMAKEAHNERYGEERLRLFLSLLTMVPNGKAALYAKWFVSLIKSEAFDYPIKKRAVYILGLYASRGATDVIDILYSLRRELKDDRLKEDILDALSSSSDIERAKKLLDMAAIDPNGVDVDEIRSCGLNEYTVKILTILIRDGLADVKGKALDILMSLAISSNGNEELKKIIGANYGKVITLYWRPEYIAELKSALIEMEPLFSKSDKMAGKINWALGKLSEISQIIAPNIAWEERTELTLNRINSPHYYVRTPFKTGVSKIRGIRETAETEESFLFVRGSGEEIFYETGENEATGSASSLTSYAMKDIIKIRPDEVMDLHIHPGRYTGQLTIDDMPSVADITASLIDSIGYDDIYRARYSHWISAPDGTFIIRPHEITRIELWNYLNGSDNRLARAIKEFERYASDIFGGKKVAEMTEVKRILGPLADVDFEPLSEGIE